ncbi:ATP-binding cassette domain-containing protein [Aquicoccus sp. SCR17]|nr:ATP-binding cassette domain-containing protein [Carideicomes alvinocaridis]
MIRLGGLVLDRGARRVLDGITLDLSERRIGLIGLNGSGKTTLARVICGLVSPDEGRVELNGIDPAKDRRGALQEVGLIFQNPDHQIIFPTVAEELAFGLRQQRHADPEGEAARVLAAFGRADWAERAVATLSQGQRHLVCLMSVFAMRPSLVLLDEPFAGLDRPTTAQLHRMIAGYEGTVIHITHQLEWLEDYDRIVWIDRGRVRADGAPAEVLTRYRAATESEEGFDAFADLPG